MKKTTHLSLLFKFILSRKLSNSVWGSDVLLFAQFCTIHKYSIHCVLFFYWIHYVVVYIFGKFWCLIKKYVICMISFSRFSDVLTAFTYARAIGNLWNICYAANILSCVWSKTLLSQNLATRTKSNGSPLPLSCLLKSRLF